MAQRKPHSGPQTINKEDEGRLWREQVIEANHKGGQTRRLYAEAEQAKQARRQREARLLQEEAARENAAYREEAKQRAEQARIEEAQRLRERQRREQREAALRKKQEEDALHREKRKAALRREQEALQREQESLRKEEEALRREKKRLSEEDAQRIRRQKVEEQRRRMAEQKKRSIERQKRAVPERDEQKRPERDVRKTSKRDVRKTPERDVRRAEKTGRRRKEKKVFTRGFKKGFWIAWGIFTALLIAVMVLLWSFLNRYEKAQPEHYMNQILEAVETGSLDDLHLETEDGIKIDDVSIFADKTMIAGYLAEKDKASALEYVKVNAESKGDENVYVIRSGDESLLKVTISRNNGGKGKNVSWNETRSQLMADDLKVRTITAQIPSKCTLVINGRDADRSFITEEKAQIAMLSELRSAGFLGKMPTLDTYTVEGIFPEQTEVSMRNAKGKIVPCTLTKDVYSAGFEAGKKFVKQQKQRVLSIFEPYALYFSGDANKNVLNQIMLVGSPAYKSASAADVSWMQAHDGIELEDKSVSNFRKYSDECFSCDIHFSEKIMRNGEAVRTWDTNMTWIFVWDGDYYIADLITKTAEEANEND